MVANALGYKHKKVQRLRRLLRQSSMRETERRFVIEGAKSLQEAITSGADIESVFVSADAPAPVVQLAHETKQRVHILATGVLQRVADAVTPQPIAAIVAMRDVPISSISDAKTVAVLVDVRDPGNAGTIMRSVEAAGGGAVVFCKGSVDVYNPKTVRSSAGSVFHLPFVRDVEPQRVFESLRNDGFTLLGTVVDGGERYDSVDLSRKIAVVLGNEANGLPAGLDNAFDTAISIPIQGHSESLNVGMAMTVLAFEAARQRSDS